MKYGFHKQADGYLYETDFIGGDFYAVIRGSEKGIISAEIDRKQFFFNLIESWTTKADSVLSSPSVTL